MKKIFFLASLLVTFGISSLKAQYVTIPDANFRNYLKSNFPTCFNANDELDSQCPGILYTGAMNLSNLNITSLEGIQYFKNIDQLICTNNKINYIPSFPSKIYALGLENNQLTTLPPLPPNLTFIYCFNNKLTELPPLPASIKTYRGEFNCYNQIPTNPYPYTTTLFIATPNNVSCSNFAFSIDGPSNVCVDNTAYPEGALYTVPNPEKSYYKWFVPPGAYIKSGQGTSSIRVVFTNIDQSGEISAINSFYNIPVVFPVQVHAPSATIDIVASKESICEGESCILNATGSGVTYTWNKGVQNNSPFRPYETTEYTVSAVDEFGCVNQESKTISILSNPYLSVEASKESICAGEAVTLLASGDDQAEYTWTGCASNGVPFYPSSTTSYTVFATNTDGCTSTSKKTIEVKPIPSLSVVASDDIVCEGEEIILSSFSNVAVTWSDNRISSVPFKPAYSNTYTATTVANADGCLATASVTVLVYPKPTDGSPLENLSICSGNSTTLYASGSGELRWYNAAVGGNPIGADYEFTTPVLSSTTTYYVSDNTCAFDYPRTPITVIVNSGTSAPTVVSPLKLTQGATATSLTAVGSNLLWYTSATGGIGTAQAPTPSTSAVGTTNYYVSQTLNGCESSRSLLAVEITAPVANLIGPSCFKLNTTYTYQINPALTTNATRYSWWVNGSVQKINPLNSPTTSISTGKYFSGGEVCVVVDYSKSPWSSTFCTPVTLCPSGVREETPIEPSVVFDIEVYPNPSVGDFTLTSSQNVYGIVVKNSLGNNVYSLEKLTANESIHIGNSLAAGIYIVQYSNADGKKFYKKIIKQ